MPYRIKEGRVEQFGAMVRPIVVVPAEVVDSDDIKDCIVSYLNQIDENFNNMRILVKLLLDASLTGRNLARIQGIAATAMRFPDLQAYIKETFSNAVDIHKPE